MENCMPSYVAGSFYPDNPAILQSTLSNLLNNCDKLDLNLPKAIISPHAGYIYSGPIAATIYSTLKNYKDEINKVVLFGPAHKYPLLGISGTKVDYFQTPLGNVKVDREIMQNLVATEKISLIEEAFFQEHCLEVQLPFLQTVLDNFSIVPLLIGDAEYSKVSKIIEKLFNEKVLFVISSDLSHYHNYYEAKKIDEKTTKSIESLNPDDIYYDNACGRIAIQGLLDFAKKNNLSVKTLDVRNSGDTAGDKDRVVGYGAYYFG